MFDFEIAFYLYKISRILEIFERNKYKSKAFHNAGMAIDAYGTFIQDMFKRGEDVRTLEGIGDSSAKIIKEVLSTGKCDELHRLEVQYGISDYSLILSYGIKSHTIKKLFDYGIKDVASLRNAITQDGGYLMIVSVSELREIRTFLQNYVSVEGKYLRSYVACLAKEVVDMLNATEAGVIAVWDMTWEDKPMNIKIYCKVTEQDKALRLIQGSSRYCNIQMNESGLLFDTAFGIPVQIKFVELPLFQPKKVMSLLGDLHTHTKWSDGKHSIFEMTQYAKRLGRKYIGITDHSYALKIARGMSEVDALQQIEEIGALRQEGIKVLSGIEVEILKDGSLDYSDEVLSKFDFVIAGIHTFMQMPAGEMQRRVEKALSNPFVNILAHPTGKLLGRPGVLFSGRDGYTISIKQLISLCEKYDVALELNCFPERFDVGMEHLTEIEKSNVYVSVGTDSHSVAHLNCLVYAEEMLAQFPKLKGRVLNCMEADDIIAHFNKKKKNRLLTDNETLVASVVKKDFGYFFKENSDIMSGRSTVVGIDLTGRETKPSGWAALVGDKAITKLICTDDELIAESLKYSPKVVSIDSPLSYPEGRCCTDTNCDCKKYGITRYCERLLFNFGIGVYPCLIPSMVNLTNRGIRLAKRFRDLGVNVIESYPGVAQDMLNIRRKQNGIDHLINSYKNFGIKGDYLLATKISHDELDAVASALVGMFYINNQYIELGNDKENYLIVPSVSKRKTERQIIIGLIGEINAGKTTLAEYLKFKYGFKTLRYSKIISELYRCEEDRKALQEMGVEIAKNPEAQRRLSLEMIERIEADKKHNYVVDGFRHEIDFNTFKSRFKNDFIPVYIEASFMNSFNRYNKRRERPASIEEFKLIYNNESERDIFLLRTRCYSEGYIIENNKTFKDYYESFEILLKETLCL